MWFDWFEIFLILCATAPIIAVIAAFVLSIVMIVSRKKRNQKAGEGAVCLLVLSSAILLFVVFIGVYLAWWFSQGIPFM